MQPVLAVAFQPGLLVGVPGMLSGMYQAHQLYGRYVNYYVILFMIVLSPLLS